MLKAEKPIASNGFKKKSKIDEAMNIDYSHQTPSIFAEETLFTEHIDLYENLIKIIEQDKETEGLNIYERELVFINKMQAKLFELFGIYSEKWVDIMIKVIYLNNPN